MKTAVYICKTALLLVVNLALMTGLVFAEKSVVTDLPTAVIKYPEPATKNDPRAEYYTDLLELALSKTVATDGPFKITYVTHLDPAARTDESMRDGVLDVTVNMTTVELEKKLLPIKVPLTKGLIGYRIFIINEADKAEFKRLGETGGLKTKRACQSVYWADFKILNANGFPTEGCLDYDTNFKLVSMGRVDYFPRSVLEIFPEVQNSAYTNLTIDDAHLMIYPAAIYFFVGNHNPSLASRIEKGLLAAKKDGSFDKLFFAYLDSQQILTRAKLKERRVYYLNNPLLPPDTPMYEDGFWITLDDMAVHQH